MTQTTPTPRPILLVDDYPFGRTTLRTLSRWVGRSVVQAATYAEGAERLAVPLMYAGLLLDVKLSENEGAPTGLGLLEMARGREPMIPAAIVTGHLEREYVQRAAGLGALYVLKPFERDGLRAFAEAARRYEAGLEDVEAFVDRVLDRMEVGRESQPGRILRMRVRGASSAEVRAALGRCDETYKSHCRVLCRASGHAHVTELVGAIWRELARGGDAERVPVRGRARG